MATNRYKDLLDYTVAYKTVWSIVGVVFALGVAVLIAWHELKPATEVERARQDVKGAERLLQRAESCGLGQLTPADQELLDDGKTAVQSARDALATKAHAQAIASAQRAQDALKTFVDRVCSARDVVAEFRRIQGEVKVKKVNSPRWVLARKGPLAVGDRIWATSGVAEVFYPASGETQQLRPGTVIEIRQVLRQADGSAGTETRLESGEMSMESSPNSISSIIAPHARVAPSGDAVEVHSPEGASDTEVTALRGVAKVSTESGGEIQMGRNTRVVANQSGRLGELQPVLDSPEPKEPIDGRIFAIELPAKTDVVFKWLAVEQAQGYRFQLSSNDLFAGVLNAGDQERTGSTSVVVEIPKPNTYHWRIAAIDRNGVQGRWSEVRKFSVRGGKLVTGQPAPVIEILDQTPVGDRVIIKGRTGQYVRLEANLNGHKYKEVPVDEKGEFQVLIRLSQDGKNVIEFVATDTYGQETRLPVEQYFSLD